MEAVVRGKKYNTANSTLIASDRYWDGYNFDRRGRNQYLYKTKKGNFFLVITSLWVGEESKKIVPLEVNEAMDLWESLPEREITYEEAFGVEPEEA